MGAARQLQGAARSAWHVIAGGGADFLARRRAFHEERSSLERQVLDEAKDTPGLFEPNVCPSCGGREVAARLANPVGFTFAVCARDRMLYMDPAPSEATLERLYNSPGYEARWLAAEGGGRRLAERLDCETLLRMAGDEGRGRLLDVGCASGAFLEIAREHFDVEGVELSEASASAARAKGLTVSTGRVADVPGGGEFDVVTMLQIVEHIVRPGEALEEARRLLKPGGLLYVNTPNIDSASFRYVGRLHRHIGGFAHVSLFNRAALLHLVERYGFECVAHEHWGPSYLALHDAISLAISKERFAHGLSLYSPRLYHASNLVEQATLGLLNRLLFPKGLPAYQRALFRKR